MLRHFVLRAPPNIVEGFGVSFDSRRARRDSALRASCRLVAGAAALLLDLFTRSAGDMLDERFENDLVKALLGFDAVVGNYASPYTRRLRLCDAAPRVRRGERQEGRLGPRHRRHGRDHPGDGESGARRMAPTSKPMPACAR